MPETTTATSGTGSRWGSGTQTGGTAPSTMVPGGEITVVGFGDQSTTRRGPNVLATYGDFKGYSSAEINGILEAMIYNKDPRLNSLMRDLGVSNVNDLRKIWRKAASTASSIAKTGQNVDFFTVLSSPSTYGPTSGGPKAQQVQQYRDEYFTKTGKPNAAAKQLLQTTLGEVLGRVPTAQEIAEYQPVFDEMRKRQGEGLFTKRYDPNTGVTTPGINPAEWLKQQVQNRRQARIQYGKEEAQQTYENKYARLASDYGYNPYDTDGKTLSEAARLQLSKIESGKMTFDEAQEMFKQAALAKYSYLKPQFDAGLTLRQIADPAISAISSILEKDANAVTVNDPMVQKYLYGTDGRGVMPMYKYESMLRQDPSWQFTKNAREQMSGLASFIGRKFGINA